MGVEARKAGAIVEIGEGRAKAQAQLGGGNVMLHGVIALRKTGGERGGLAEAFRSDGAAV